MLGKKEAPAFDKVESVLGKGMVVTGTLCGKGSIRVEGKLQGDLQVDGDVYVAQGATVEAHVTARHMTVAGTVVGDVILTGRLELGTSAKLQGDIKVATLSVGEGATFKGSCEMRKETPTIGDKVNSNEGTVQSQQQRDKKGKS